MKSLVLGIAMAVLLIAMQCAHAAPAANADPDDAFLDSMSGDWIMSGPTLGKPTRYTLRAARVLNGGFVRLDLVDTRSPPQYQASVFIGFDKKKNDYVAHWLDQFGAAGARVIGEGLRSGDTLVLLFPYEDGAFRDTFTYEPDKNTWNWLLESQEKGGKWSVFAKYDVARP